MIVTLIVSEQVPYSDRVISRQTQFDVLQMNQSLANTEIARLRESVLEELRTLQGPAVLCTDGLVRVRRK